LPDGVPIQAFVLGVHLLLRANLSVDPFQFSLALRFFACKTLIRCARSDIHGCAFCPANPAPKSAELRRFSNRSPSVFLLGFVRARIIRGLIGILTAACFFAKSARFGLLIPSAAAESMLAR
jgi:hypothetical protein